MFELQNRRLGALTLHFLSSNMLELKKQKIERQILWSDRLCIPISKAGTIGSILLKANPSMFLTREMLVPSFVPPGSTHESRNTKQVHAHSWSPSRG